MNSKITPERDARNKRMIGLSIFNSGGMTAAEQHRLIHEASPEERAAYVRMKLKCYFVGACVIVGFFIISAIIPLA